jgi:pSer/pThr/pTyr-binding forkhead associated (FHA) protein
MNDFFTRVDGAMRSAVHRVQTWFDPPLDGAARPLEIREAIIENIEQRVEPAGGGRRVLPYNHVTITVLAADKPARARLQAALAGLQQSVVERLTEIRCAVPAGFAVETRYITRPATTWTAHQRLAFDYHAREVSKAPATVPEEPPRLRIAIARGEATHASYTFSESHVRIGRSAQPIDGHGRPRTNHVVFLEDGDGYSRTVGRAHASIRYDSARNEYRVFDDGSHNGTRVMRDGALYEVKPHDPVGVTLRSGDEIQFGTAAVRVLIDARDS